MLKQLGDIPTLAGRWVTQLLRGNQINSELKLSNGWGQKIKRRHSPSIENSDPAQTHWLEVERLV
jgi:hypothetical protein